MRSIRTNCAVATRPVRDPPEGLREFVVISNHEGRVGEIAAHELFHHAMFGNAPHADEIPHHVDNLMYPRTTWTDVTGGVHATGTRIRFRSITTDGGGMHEQWRDLRP